VATSASTPVRRANPAIRASGSTPSTVQPAAWNCRAAERDLHRVAPDADVDTLAAMLIGTAHLQFFARRGAPPEPQAVRRIVTTVIRDA
jgi:hypothetical protein